MIVSYNMSELKVFKAMLKGPKSDVIILITTCLLTVIFDLVVAIEIGMVIAMFLFMRRMANNLEVNMMDSDECAEFTELNGIDTSNIGKGIVVYEIEGALFFGAVDTFMDAIKKIDSESSVLILRMRHVSMLDATGYKVLKNIEEKCNKDNIKLVMSGVNDQPYKVMKNMGMVKRLGKERFNRKFKDAVILSNRLISE